MSRPAEAPPTLLARLSKDQMADLLTDRPPPAPSTSYVALRKCPTCRQYATQRQDACCGRPL